MPDIAPAAPDIGLTPWIWDIAPAALDMGYGVANKSTGAAVFQPARWQLAIAQ